jgi:hypothetical protein
MLILLKRFVSVVAFCILSLIGHIAFGQLADDLNSADPGDAYAKAQVRYAQACLDLARLELSVALQAESSYSTAALNRLRNNVKVADERLRVVKLPPSEVDAIPVHLRYAQEKARLVKSTYLQALANKTKNAFSETQLEQLRLRAEVAESRLALWNYPAQTLSFLDHIHWEMDRLGEAIIDLQQRQDKYESK